MGQVTIKVKFSYTKLKQYLLVFSFQSSSPAMSSHHTKINDKINVVNDVKSM